MVNAAHLQAEVNSWFLHQTDSDNPIRVKMEMKLEVESASLIFNDDRAINPAPLIGRIGHRKVEYARL
jgi:hypothetical protein